MPGNHNIEKLNSSNCNKCSDIKFLLMERNLSDIIDEEKVIPTKSESITDEEFSKIKSRFNLVLSVIYSTTSLIRNRRDHGNSE